MRRIGIDARVAMGGTGGWARYAEELLSALAKLDSIVIEILLPDNSRAARLLESIRQPGRVGGYLVPFRPRWSCNYWDDDHAPPEKWLGRVELLHSLTRFTAPTKIRPVISTVHDIVSLSEPPFKVENRDATLGALDTLRQPGYWILSVSEFTKRELIEFGGMNPDSIEVVHEGVCQSFCEAVSDHQQKLLLEEIDVTQPYILYVGSARENKNLACLMEAMRELRKTSNMQLVLAGDPDYGYESVKDEIENGKPWIRFAKYVDDAQLRTLYHGATAFVMPSLHEGFGLSLLEAMLSGTVLACSDIPVFREVAQDGALYFDPHNPQSTAKVLQDVISDPALCIKMKKRGLAQAQAFTWQRAAEQTVETYEHFLRKN